MKFKYSIVLITCLLLMQAVRAQEISKVGTSVCTFLKMDVGARQVGMGSASVANTENALSLYWNPAGISRLRKNHAVFNHMNWIADISYNYAAFVLPMGGLGNLGVSATFVSMDPMVRTTVENPTGTGETFSAGDFAMGITYARMLTDRFSIGGTVKVIREEIYNCSATGIAFDLGTLFTTQFNGLQMGMSISNYGTKMQMDGRDLLTRVDIAEDIHGNNETINAILKTERFDLPLFFRLGLAMDLLQGAANSNLLLSVDALHPSVDVEYVNVGGEYAFNRMFYLRAGYKALFAENAEEGLSFGGGIRMTLMRNEIAIDYAYRDFGRLGDIQMYTVGLMY